MGLSKLSDNEIQEGLRELNGWSVQNGKLHKEIEFSDFEIRRDQQFWKHIQKLAPVWDDLINEFNSQTGLIKTK